MNPTTLPRIIGPWMAGAIVIGTVIGSGVYKKGRTVADNCPEFGLAISVWVLGGVLALLGALTIAEVASRIPKAGGNYAFLRDTYGRWAGFLWGWVDFGIIRTSSIAVLAVMFIESLSDVLVIVHGEAIGRWPRLAGTLGVIGGLTLVNIRGTRIGGGLQMVLTILKVGSLLALIALPLAVVAFVPAPETKPTTANFFPLWPNDLAAIDWVKYGGAIVAVMWAYHGWLNIAPIAEEVQDPQRNIPRSLIGGILVLIALYVGANIAYYTAVPVQDMVRRDANQSLSSTPLSTEFCARLLGPAGVLVASLILMTSVFGSLNGNILVAPRLLYAMSDDGLSPRHLRDVHPRYLTPAKAMLVFSGWSMLLVTLAEVGKEIDLIDPKKQIFDILTDYCIVGAIMFETLGVVSLFVLRRRSARPDLPYRCPGYPVVPALYVLVMAAVLANMFIGTAQRTEACVGAGYALLGGLIYFLFLRRKPAG